MRRRSRLYLSCVLVAACQPSDDTAKEAQQKTPVSVQQIERADITEVLTYVADLRPLVEVKIFSPLPDRIVSFPWQDGDVIKRGERVASVRREGLDKGLEQMSAQVEGLDAQLKHLTSELGRAKDLLAAGVITRQTFDQTQASYEQLSAQRRALEANRQQLEVSAGNAILRAPITGVIADRQLEVGDMASPQVPLCRIMAVESLEAELRLIETDVAKVHIGQRVRLHLDAFPNRVFEGRVTTILPYLDAGTRTNTVEVLIPNPEEGDPKERLLKPGMFGRAEVVLDVKERVLAAPEHALLLDNAILAQQRRGELLRKAFVVDAEGVAHQRTVRLGARASSVYEVLEGLAEGDWLVVRGQHGLADGDVVEVIAQAGKGSASAKDAAQ